MEWTKRSAEGAHRAKEAGGAEGAEGAEKLRARIGLSELKGGRLRGLKGQKNGWAGGV